MVSYEKVCDILDLNHEFDFFHQLNDKEQEKIDDFYQIFLDNVDTNNDTEVICAAWLMFMATVKVYLKYKDVYPTISTNEDPYKYYVIQPNNGSYQLLDYLINRLIEGVQKIIIIDDSFNTYSYVYKELSLNSSRYGDFEDINNLDKSQTNEKLKNYVNEYNLTIAKLYFKSIIHEVGHALHSCHSYESDDSLIAPVPYINEGYDKNAFLQKVKFYEKLSNKYNIVKVDDNTPIQSTAKFDGVPSGWLCKGLEEAFTEMEAEDYANLNINTGAVRQFIGNIYYAAKTPSNGYSLGANYLRVVLKSISKKDQFEIAFLGEDPSLVIDDYDSLEEILDDLKPGMDGKYYTSKNKVLQYFSDLYANHMNESDVIELSPIINFGDPREERFINDYYQEYLSANNCKKQL